MTVAAAPLKTYRGQPVDAAPASFGALTDSSALRHDGPALRERLATDGYVFLPGALRRDDVLAARQSMLERLDAVGMIDRRYPLLEGIVKENASSAFNPALAKANPAVETLLYSGPLMEIMALLHGGAVRHYDYTWVRCKGGQGGREPTFPHYDICYMGRGTDKLLTAWTPIGDVPWEMGGLMVLEGSHRHEQLKATYGRHDVDKVCANRPDGKPAQDWPGTFGWYSDDAFWVQHQLGGRWLGSEYRMGDVLIFCMYLMHGSMDNHTNRYRLSTDSRYQLASEPIDDRWIGTEPAAHGPRAKRQYIC
jgi:hypothetical protein